MTAVADAQFPAGIDPERLRDAVRGRYAPVGSAPGGSYSFRVGCDFAEAVGYPSELLDGIPPIATEAFTGVAVPILRAELQPGETVLDLGCGGGLDLALAARAVGPTGRAIGVDMAETMVERANATLRALGFIWAEARVAHAEALPLAEGTVDAVVASGRRPRRRIKPDDAPSSTQSRGGATGRCPATDRRTPTARARARSSDPTSARRSAGAVRRRLSMPRCRPRGRPGACRSLRACTVE